MSPCALNPGCATLPGGIVKQGWQPGGPGPSWSNHYMKPREAKNSTDQNGKTHYFLSQVGQIEFQSETAEKHI